MEKMCHPIAMAFFDTADDPIAKFNEHELSLLDSALNNPRQTYGGKELYPTLTKKVAILYYCLIKNHPFDNGNKRIATVSLLVFLHINNYWLMGDKKEIDDFLVKTAIEVAKSKSREKDSILINLETWFENHVIKQA